MTPIQLVIDGADEPWISWFAHDAPLPRVGDFVSSVLPEAATSRPARFRVREVEFKVRTGPHEKRGRGSGGGAGPARIILYVERVNS